MNTCPSLKTKQELAKELDHLDPGCSLKIGAAPLEFMFGPGGPVDLTIQEAKQFAEEHRCTLSSDRLDRGALEFFKDDAL